MNIQINSIHFNADKKLKDFISTKVNRLDQYDDKILSAEVNLSLEKSQTKNFDSKVSKIKVFISGGDFFAEKKSQTFEAATDAAVTAIKNQLVKNKDKKRQ